jgi:glycerophosphoryl diester phosphodiesterase
VLIIGHRGAAAVAPENTLSAISRAIEIGVDAVEVDVRMTKDEQVVVIHDEAVDRTTNGTGRVEELHLHEIKRLDAGRGECVPTLEEVFDFVGNRVRIFVELKEGKTEEAVVELIRAHQLFDTTVVISFWHRLVRRVKELDRRVRTGVLMVGCPADAAVAFAARADCFMMKYTFVDKAFVDVAHRNGLQVFIWNIDEGHLAQPYAAMGVDGIGSNDPQSLVSLFRS